MKLDQQVEDKNWKCCLSDTLDAASNKLVKHAIDTYNDGSKICFGENVYEMLCARKKDGQTIDRVVSDEDYLKQKKLCATKNLGILWFDERFSVGADLRFSNDSEVLVLDFNSPKYENIAQKMARGTRSLGEYNGVLFSRGAEADETSYREYLSS